MKKILNAVAALTIGSAIFALLPAQEPVFATKGTKPKDPNGVLLGPPTTGAPFSAAVVIETTQTLADGNRIVQKRSQKVYRDRLGRERTESPEVGVARIGDPVANLSYRLDMKNQTAEQLPPLSFPMYPLNQYVAFPRADAPARAAAQGSTMTMEELGTETIEGVATVHTRSTYTTPPGKRGNEKAIVTVDEWWYSPDLKMYVMTRRNSPLQADQVFRLTQIDRSDPDPALFQVPPGYTLSVKAAKSAAR